MKRNAPSEFEISHAIKSSEQHSSIQAPLSLERPISPPVIAKRIATRRGPKLAAVEAGEASVDDHLSFFSFKLLEASKPSVVGLSRISYQAWSELYQRNLHPHGRHFVIHQHDHPVAGTHYDLRLQCNGTSSISFAIMYGLPGDPNSRRLNRNAAETRVHNLWVGFLYSYPRFSDLDRTVLPLFKWFSW